MTIHSKLQPKFRARLRYMGAKRKAALLPPGETYFSMPPQPATSSDVWCKLAMTPSARKELSDFQNFLDREKAEKEIHRLKQINICYPLISQMAIDKND